jgi:hypothetical protein
MHCVEQVLKMKRAWFVQWWHGCVNRKWAGNVCGRIDVYTGFWWWTVGKETAWKTQA